MRSPIMPQQTSIPHVQTTLRRSLRLRKLEILRAKAGSQGQNTTLECETSNQQSFSNDSAPKILELAVEIRRLIFSYNITTERPFMIGRCQEDRRKTEGSPRDIISFYQGKFRVRRDNRTNRPKQPSITRVCRRFCEEALTLWYSENHFWLIHNEFQLENEVPNLHRRFDAWISQTPREMFNFMQHSLCGYSNWPNRITISIDLKSRQIINIRHYSTYGDNLPIYKQEFIDSTKRALASKADSDGLAALKAVLTERDSLFQLSKTYRTSPPGMMRREPASGWEYDW